MRLKSIKSVIICGILSGWFVYFLTVLISQSMLENAIGDVRLFEKLFDNDPALAASIKYSIESDKITNMKRQKYKETNMNVMAWRIAQNLEIISADDKPNEMSRLVNKSLGSLLDEANLSELQQMTGIEIIYEVMSKAGSNPSDDSKKQITMELLKNGLAGSPMAFREYLNYVKYTDELSTFPRKSMAYLFPPELTSSYWNKSSINEIQSLAYKHLRLASEFGALEERDGKLENINAYNQFNDLMLKLFLMVMNDEEVVAARDRLMIFKGIVQWLILMTFFITLYLILFLDFTTRNNERLLDLLKTMLPTLGFIGTILGLMRSLGNAYKIPIASGNANTSFAISEITTSLSIAFTTTLLAFVLLIIVDIIRVYKLKRLVVAQ